MARRAAAGCPGDKSEEQWTDIRRVDILFAPNGRINSSGIENLDSVEDNFIGKSCQVLLSSKNPAEKTK